MFPHTSHDATDLYSETVLRVDGPSTATRVFERHGTALRVLDGVVGLVVGDDEFLLTPGDEASIPAGVPHRCFNAGDDDARVIEIPGLAHCAPQSFATVRHARHGAPAPVPAQLERRAA